MEQKKPTSIHQISSMAVCGFPFKQNKIKQNGYLKKQKTTFKLSTYAKQGQRMFLSLHFVYSKLKVRHSSDRK